MVSTKCTQNKPEMPLSKDAHPKIKICGLVYDPMVCQLYVSFTS